MGRNGGQMVSVLAFYSVSTSSNHIRVYSFYSAKLFEKTPKNNYSNFWNRINFSEGISKFVSNLSSSSNPFSTATCHWRKFLPVL